MPDSDDSGQRSRRGIVRAVVMLLALLAVAATPSGMALLPAQYLKQRTFQSPDAWFAIETPSDGWEWFEMRGFDGDADPRWPDAVHRTVAWFARDPKSAEDCVIMESYMPSGPMVDDAYSRGIETGVRRTLSADETLTNFTIERLSVPVKDSLHYRYEVHKKSGKVTYHFVYVSGWEHKVFLQTSSATAQEPPLFRRMVVSMRWLQQP